MEIHDERLISFLSILEKIERMNKAIGFYQGMETPDMLAIAQYEKMKQDLINNLFELLFANYEINVNLTPTRMRQVA
jgi:hypothetical protein